MIYGYSWYVLWVVLGAYWKSSVTNVANVVV